MTKTKQHLTVAIPEQIAKSGKRILAAVSGGSDSVAMLAALSEAVAPQRIAAAHFNHGLRGKEADRDEAGVKKIAESLGVEFVRGGADVRELSLPGESCEMAARRLRHDFLRKTASELGCCAIATGHTANDRLENVFLRLARGCGLDGLSGMSEARDAGGGIVLFRPVFEYTRDDLRSFLISRGISWFEDSTNEDTSIPRNSARKRVVPAFLSAFGSSAIFSAMRTLDNLRSDAEYLNSQADLQKDKAVSPDGALIAAELSQMPYPIAGRIVMKWLFDADTDPESVTRKTVDRVIELCRGADRGTVRTDISDNVFAVRTNGSVRLEAESGRGKMRPGRIQYDIDLSPVLLGHTVRLGPFEFGGARDRVCMTAEPSEGIERSPRTAPGHLPAACTISRQAAASPLSLRTPEDGDRIVPAGKHFSKKLSDIFTEMKVPRTQRRTIPVIALPCKKSGQYGIVWLPGYAVSEYAAVKDGRSVKLIITRNN